MNYPIGTVCIGKSFTVDTQYNNMECEIIGPLEMGAWHAVSTDEFGESLGYDVRWANGVENFALTYQLRLPKEPPKQSDSQWADEAIRKLKKQSSDHVVIGKPELIPEEA